MYVDLCSEQYFSDMYITAIKLSIYRLQENGGSLALFIGSKLMMEYNKLSIHLCPNGSDTCISFHFISFHFISFHFISYFISYFTGYEKKHNLTKRKTDIKNANMFK